MTNKKPILDHNETPIYDEYVECQEVSDLMKDKKVKRFYEILEERFSIVPSIVGINNFKDLESKRAFQQERIGAQMLLEWVKVAVKIANTPYDTFKQTKHKG